MTHENLQSLAAGINPYNPAFQSWLASTGLSMTDPRTQEILGSELTRQATMIGFIEAFGFVTLSFLVLIPFVLFLKQTGAASPFGGAGNH